MRGKKVTEALINLDFVAKKASLPIKNLIASALANAKALDIPTDNLIVKTITVDSGKILYRRRPVAHGSAHPIRKRTSAIFVELGEAPAGKKVKKLLKQGASEKVLASSEETKKPKGRKKTLAPRN